MLFLPLLRSPGERLSLHSGCSHPVGIHHLREDWEGESTCPCQITPRGRNEGSNGWWPGLLNQQQHTAGVCLSLPSTLTDRWSGGPRMVLALGCSLEPLFTLAAAVAAEGALSWSPLDEAAECHSARGSTGWTHPTRHCAEIPGAIGVRESHSDMLLPGGRHDHGTALLEDSVCDPFHCPPPLQSLNYLIFRFPGWPNQSLSGPVIASFFLWEACLNTQP